MSEQYAVWAPKEYHGRASAPKAKITNPAGGQWSLSKDSQRMANWRRASNGARAQLGDLPGERSVFALNSRSDGKSGCP